MKCCQCSSTLNAAEGVAVPRLGPRVRVALCTFCGSFNAGAEEGGAPQPIAACTSCGAPHDGAPGSACARCRVLEAGPDRRGEAAEEVGPRLLKEALKQFPAIETKEAAGYFARVLASVEDALDIEPGSTRVLPVSQLGPHALSLPGGTILLGDELLRSIEDEAMLAFLVAREISHVQSGRTYRRLSWRGSTGALSAGIEWSLGILTGGALPPGRLEAELLREVAVLGYGAAHEQEADDLGVKALAAAGYDTDAASRFLTQLEKRQVDARGALAAFLDAHPPRSRRRCLLETLTAIQGRGDSASRIGREVHRRAISAITRDEALPQGARRSLSDRHPVGS